MTPTREELMKKKILIVDDSRTALILQTMILEKGPYLIRTARDGQEAVRMARSERPDLILMDVVMPTMNGVEACREMRADPVLRDIPIILASTRGEEQNVEAGWSAGCNDYVTKPFNGAELLEKVRDLLGSPESDRASV